MYKPLLFAAPLFLFLASPAKADDAESRFLKQVYPNGGKTLYCREEFTPDSRISVEEIYGDRRLAQHFGCRSGRLCANNPEYQEAVNDRHGLFPVTLRLELVRRRSLFGDLPAGTNTNEDCGYKLSFQVFEPPATAKGDIARAMLYLHERYKLPLLGPLEMYIRWNEEDPVDADEKNRNTLIARLQGNRNPFIDNPARANTLKGTSPLNLQFP